jgi:inosine-uridine nucleoside N-ribohydrolase
MTVPFGRVGRLPPRAARARPRLLVRLFHREKRRMTRSRIRTRVIVAALLASVACTGETATSEPLTTSTVATTTTERATSTEAPANEGHTPVILDYSPTVSDVGALLYLLSEPTVELVAITLPETGEAACELGLDVTVRILALFDRPEVPVACGRGIPDGANPWPETFLEGASRLRSGLPIPTSDPLDEDAADLLVDLISDADRPPVIVAVAPLTNLGRALLDAPEIARSIERIVIMGGAVDVEGNVDGASAEWNVWVDVEAARAVFGSGAPITLVPLDATNDVPVPAGWPVSLQRAPTSAAVRYVAYLARVFPSVTSGFYYFWDELAATVALHPETVTTEEAALAIGLAGSDRGRTMRTEDGTAVEVATSVPDPDAFYDRYLTALAGEAASAFGTLDDALSAYFSAVDASFSEARQRLEVFLDGLFGPGAFDGDAAAADLAAAREAFIAHRDVMSTLVPPADLVEVHIAYLAAFEELLDSSGVLLDVLAESESPESAFAQAPPLDTFEPACLDLLAEATYRRAEVGLFCSP